jgi:acyl carrier protein
MESDVSLKDFVFQMIGRACNIDSAALQLETDVLNIGVDSLSLMFIASSVEVMTGVELSAEDMEELFKARQISEIVALVDRVRMEESLGL